MRVLVFGSTGQLARALQRTHWPKKTSLLAVDREAADFSRPERLGKIVQKHRPDAVVIAAAYTQVDKAESEQTLADTVNAIAPGEIASAAAALAIPVVHISSDYVFDGEKDGFYVEGDPVGPIGAYGRSKLAGEIAVRDANPRHLILRTSWVYAAEGTNFFRSMLRLAENHDEVRIVADQHGCPTAAGDIAAAIASGLPAVLNGNANFGTYHVAGAESTTWHGFAEVIFAGLAARGLRRPRNVPVGTADYPTPARRPRNSRLSSELFTQHLRHAIPGFHTALPTMLDAVGLPSRLIPR